ncbi:tRNA:m(4)X modification enzyme TRM13 homolog isoform X1 [Sitophilus oryzae]|uniref:tRNA:m(4)X modification enzyme TRM13 n=1 Tax=Sitophilus oryzae TaxID=7048 RepID=A0A6J2Y5P3_SITOR|nr:tRNA:m(4)X modification enzyme TRM13 homolog isoform X1 [Sitophilus oryzae]
MSDIRCKFFVQRKKRYCKMLVKSGQEYCGEHQKPVEDLDKNMENDTKTRILCPLDRKHTVYLHNLSKHLKICNARQDHTEPYIEKDINLGDSGKNSTDLNDSYQLLSTFSKDHILAVIQKANKLFEKYVKLSEKKLCHDSLREELSKPEYGDKTKKHLRQVSSILGLLNNFELIQDNSCYIEFGAGRGQLSYYIAEITESFDKVKLLLIERASPKHKKDNKLAKTTDRVHRIRADIKDLVLDKVDIIKDIDNIVGVTKHLCGEATDLTIKCLTNMSENRNKLKGVVLTFCCHHRCRWTPYTGKDFFTENEFTKEDFNIMCCLSSWATCGSGLSREVREKIDKDPEETEKCLEYGLKRNDREEIGRRCKNLINWGRLLHLETAGFTCSLHYYVDNNVTLENVCIVAYKK